MVDANVIVGEFLATQTPVTSLLGTNLGGSIYYGYSLPEHFDPTLGPVIQMFRVGGHSHPEIRVLVDARICIRVWAAVEDAEVAADLYSAIHDALHGLCDTTVTDGTIVRAKEVSGPLEMTDPDTGWVAEYAFYQVMLRPNGSSLPYVPQFYEGFGSPAFLGKNDDIYYDEASGDLWEQVAGAWVLVGNIPVGGGSELPASLKYHLVAAAGTNPELIKNAPGVVTGWKIYNKAYYPIFAKLFDKTTAPDLGTDIPSQTIGVDAGVGEVNPAGPGTQYANGIAFAITKGIADLDDTPVDLDDCVVDIFYQ